MQERTAQEDCDALLELKQAGKVRFIGMSGTLPHLRDHIAMGVFDVFQIPYSAMEREHEAAIATPPQAGPVSSSVVVLRKVRRRRESRGACNGNAGSARSWTICLAT
jgi:aryl-alcohol dehydrogenase-like predicted oxidoreductase